MSSKQNIITRQIESTSQTIAVLNQLLLFNNEFEFSHLEETMKMGEGYFTKDPDFFNVIRLILGQYWNDELLLMLMQWAIDLLK